MFAATQWTHEIAIGFIWQTEDKFDILIPSTFKHYSLWWKQVPQRTSSEVEDLIHLQFCHQKCKVIFSLLLSINSARFTFNSCFIPFLLFLFMRSENVCYYWKGSWFVLVCVQISTTKIFWQRWCHRPPPSPNPEFLKVYDQAHLNLPLLWILVYEVWSVKF